MRLPRPDSIFARLLLMQLSIVALAIGLLSVVLTLERNSLLAEPYGDLWALQLPALRQAAAAGVPEAHLQGTTFDLRPAPPAGWTLDVSEVRAPVKLRERMAERGVALGRVWLAWRTEGMQVWWEAPGQPPLWVHPHGLHLMGLWWERMVILAAVLALVVPLSWRFVRRVTQPLSQLRRHWLQGDGPVPAGEPVLDARAPHELRAMDQAYAHFAARLQRNERERDLLLAGVSHDLRSPLSRIRLAAEMLPETPDNAEDVAAIIRNVDHADRLIASFLEFVRSGTQALDARVDLAAAARDAVAQFKLPAGRLQAQLPGEVWLPQAHGLLVERLVFNLVDNALKHGLPPVQVRLGVEGDLAVLRVIDAGPGLPPGSSARLMEAFARGDASRGVPGFGLGLAIAQQVTTRLKGSLVFERDAEGHQAVLRLPVGGGFVSG